jgi:hypothetical protein
VNLKRLLNAKIIVNKNGTTVREDVSVNTLKSKVFITNTNNINKINIIAILRNSDSLYDL